MVNVTLIPTVLMGRVILIASITDKATSHFHISAEGKISEKLAVRFVIAAQLSYH